MLKEVLYVASGETKADVETCTVGTLVQAAEMSQLVYSGAVRRHLQGILSLFLSIQPGTPAATLVPMPFGLLGT